MAELTGFTASGGVVGDTYRDHEITIVYADTIYAWKKAYSRG